MTEVQLRCVPTSRAVMQKSELMTHYVPECENDVRMPGELTRYPTSESEIAAKRIITIIWQARLQHRLDVVIAAVQSSSHYFYDGNYFGH